MKDGAAEVRRQLEALGLSRYADKLVDESGYDDWAFMVHSVSNDIVEGAEEVGMDPAEV